MHAIMPCCIRAAVAFARILFSHFYTAECRRACVGSPHSPLEDQLPLLSTHARLSVLPRRRGPARGWGAGRWCKWLRIMGPSSTIMPFCIRAAVAFARIAPPR